MLILLLKREPPPAAHFLGRDILFVRRDVPVVTKGIFQAAGSVTVKLVFDRPHELRTRVNRSLRYGIDVLDVEHHLYRRTTK